MESKILKLLGESEYVPSNVPELLSQLRLKPARQQELQAVLSDLVKQGLIVRTKGNRYIQSREADLVPGVIQITRGGRGFVQPDEAGIGEISISESNTSTALHGDRVLVRRDVRPTGLRHASPDTNSGSVVRILERKRKQFVGTLQRSKQFLYVIPDDPRIPQNIFVPPPRDVGRFVNPGDKVVVELMAWENRQTPPEGEVIEVLGAPDAEGVDMLSVLRHYDLPLHFPKEVLDEANTIAKSRPDNQPSAEECAGRVDCRGHNVITIDPDDARDFDDAICIQPAPSGKWKLWVHIADVSHYVRPGSPLDEEARRRGNSTYLVDRVIPMLPEALSNELCSLKPHLDRLTKCVEFTLSRNGDVITAKFYPAVIHSKRRFTYQEALRVIEGTPKDEIESMLHDAHRVAQLIRKARFDNGSLDLDFPENKIRLDEQGKVLRIERMENDVSHQLIEEFMLLANEAVAADLMKRNRPAVYRIHEAPKEKKLQEYRDDVLSHRIPCGDLTHRPEVQKLLARLGELPIGAALKIGFLRSLMRARYSVEPLGHYGLAKTKYAHFTSPIRRYADLVVHRALFDKNEPTIAAMKQMAEHITETEKNSADAERDSKEVKLYAYLEAQLESGNPVAYPALVTDTRNFGFFVDVQDLGLSGVVPLSSLQDDFYMLEPVRNYLVGRHTRRVIKLGDRVTVQIYKLDRFKKQVDFQLVQEPVRESRQERAATGKGLKAKGGKPAFESRARAERPNFKGAKEKRGAGPDAGQERSWKGHDRRAAAEDRFSAPPSRGNHPSKAGPSFESRPPARQGKRGPLPGQPEFDFESSASKAGKAKGRPRDSDDFQQGATHGKKPSHGKPSRKKNEPSAPKGPRWFDNVGTGKPQAGASKGKKGKR
ncbi:MAG TPA: ribonuclease R [Prosthecobacter sp.]